MVTGMDANSNSNNTTTNNNVNNAVNSNVSPSPQSVGREFVRQYYTVLNQGPHLLHRFYSDDSSFVHGGVDKPGEVSNPVFGQDAINKKILSLNFKDCHAKIRQVDSMETIGRGVVIQVTGELSNNGQPMRRFLQTFVLAPQTPTKYYVRNDIFRYQDEIFLDEDDYSEAEKVEIELEKSSVTSLSAPKSNSDKEEPMNSVADKEFYENANGSVHDSIISGGDKLPSNDDATDEKNVDLNSSNVFEDEDFAKNDEYVSGSTSPQPQQNELKTYANMVSKNPIANFPPFAGNNFAPVVKTASESSGSLSAPFSRQSETSPVPAVINTGPTFTSQTAPISSAKPPSISGNTQPQRENRPPVRRNQQFVRRNESREMTPGRAFNDNDSADGDYGVKKQQYPDENQVFVGNLPQNIVDEDLRNLFTRYGKILDVRINRQNQKLGSNTKTPNYGFVTFECPDIVQQILKQKPIYFDNHRFNVEEKRSQQGRERTSFGSNINRSGPVGQGGGMGGRNNSIGNISANRIQTGGSAGNQRNRGNQQYNSSANNGVRGMSGGSGPSATGGGGGGFAGPRNSSFNRQQR